MLTQVRLLKLERISIGSSWDPLCSAVGSGIWARLGFTASTEYGRPMYMLHYPHMNTLYAPDILTRLFAYRCMLRFSDAETKSNAFEA